jgi:hypothetical protein
MSNNIITLDRIMVIAEPKDAGSHVELYFYLRPDNASKDARVRYPENGTISLSKSVDSIVSLNHAVQVKNLLAVTVMEADSSSADDNYGENTIAANSGNGFVDYGAEGSEPAKFRLYYITQS